MHLMSLLTQPILLWFGYTPANRPAFCRQVPLFYAKCPSKNILQVGRSVVIIFFFSQMVSSSDVSMVCSLRASKSPQPRFPVLPLMLSTVYQVYPWCYHFSHGLDRTHIFISFTYSFFTWEIVIGIVSIPYSMAVRYQTSRELLKATYHLVNDMYNHLVNYMYFNMLLYPLVT